MVDGLGALAAAMNPPPPPPPESLDQQAVGRLIAGVETLASLRDGRTVPNTPESLTAPSGTKPLPATTWKGAGKLGAATPEPAEKRAANAGKPQVAPS